MRRMIEISDTDKVRVQKCYKCKHDMSVSSTWEYPDSGLQYYCQNQKCSEYDKPQRNVMDYD